MPRWLWFSRSRVECIVKDAATCQTRNPYLLMIAVRGLCDGGFHTTEENRQKPVSAKQDFTRKIVLFSSTADLKIILMISFLFLYILETTRLVLLFRFFFKM